jgi:hypothetical protein
MDAGIIRLRETKHLKTNLWNEAARHHVHPVFSYNAKADALMLLIVDATTPKLTHYLDEYLALLYQKDSGEVIGLRIEAFRKAFVLRHATLRRAWFLSDASKELEDLSDLRIVVERQEQIVAKEVSKIAQLILERAGVKMPAFA